MDNHKAAKAMSRLLDIMAVLRSPEGCPWDAVQTPETLRTYLLEETHEVLQAINEGNPAEICDELGDLLLQVVFQARIFEERGDFDFNEVIDSITRKLIRRHPHVFKKNAKPLDTDLDRQWLSIKENEQSGTPEKSSFFGRVPPTLPSLSRAGKINDFLLKTDPETYREFVKDRFSSARSLLKDLVDSGENGPVGEEEMGCLLLFLVLIGRRNNIDLEEALRSVLSHLENFLEFSPGSPDPD